MGVIYSALKGSFEGASDENLDDLLHGRVYDLSDSLLEEYVDGFLEGSLACSNVESRHLKSIFSFYNHFQKVHDPNRDLSFQF